MTEHPSSPELLASPIESAVDPELVGLPRPPRGERIVSVALMIATAVLAAAMAIGLVGDVRYALASAEPEDIGDLAKLSSDGAANNHFVRATGHLGGTGAIRYERPLEPDSFRLTPVLGNDKMWVEMRVPEGGAPANFVPPTTFVGRIVRFEDAAFRYRGLARSVHEATGAVIPPHASVLVDGATPTASRWTVALAALFVFFAGYNLVTIARILLPVKR